MSARATTSHVLAIGNGASPEVFTRIAGVGDISSLGAEATIHDSSSHDTSDGYGTTVVGLKRLSPVSFPVQYDPDEITHSAESPTGSNPPGLVYLFDTVPAVLATFVQYPAGDPTNATRFSGWVSKIDEPVPVDGILQLQVTISPTGGPERFDATSLAIV